jgi:hypothetical protein
MPDTLPPYVYDLIAAVAKYEDEHGAGFFDAQGAIWPVSLSRRRSGL